MKARALTSVQWRLLRELAEPKPPPVYDPYWYFPRKNLRTLMLLASLGFASEGESDMDRFGYLLTDAGKEKLKEAPVVW